MYVCRQGGCLLEHLVETKQGRGTTHLRSCTYDPERQSHPHSPLPPSQITNLFARWLGGYISDRANAYAGIKGRIATQFALVLSESILIVWFSHSTSQTEATLLLLAFSVFVQAANGSCFAIVPYVTKQAGACEGGGMGGGKEAVVVRGGS